MKGQTVLMVAHRLKTAAQYCDKVLVLSQGAMVQFDTPYNLLAESQESQVIDKRDSVFAEMVLATGMSEQQQGEFLNICR